MTRGMHDETTLARRLGRSRKWRETSAWQLRQTGWDKCVACGARSEVIDHKIAHKGDTGLFWDSSNWQPMCRACNSRKNVQAEGGWGKRPGTFAPRIKGCDANGFPLDPNHPWNVDRERQ